MPPVVKFCPETQHYTVARHHETIKVSWIEPIFEDNIKVTTITKSNVSTILLPFITFPYYLWDDFNGHNKKLQRSHKYKIHDLSTFFIVPHSVLKKTQESGNHLGLGTHLITYEAKDAAGFASRCTFKIVINAPKRQILPLLYSKFYYL